MTLISQTSTRRAAAALILLMATVLVGNTGESKEKTNSSNTQAFSSREKRILREAELAILFEKSNRSSEGLPEIQLPNGGVGVPLNNRFSSFTLIRKGAQGQVITKCVEGTEEARKFLFTAGEKLLHRETHNE